MLTRRNLGLLCLLFLVMCVVLSRQRAASGGAVFNSGRPPLDLARIKAEDPFFYSVALQKEFSSGGPPRITKWAPGRVITYSVRGRDGELTSLAQFRGYVHEILRKLEGLTGLTYQEVQNPYEADVKITFVERVSTGGSGGIVSENSAQIAGLALAQLGPDGYLEAGTVQVVNTGSPEITQAVALEELTQLGAGLFFDVSDPVHSKSIFYKHKTHANLVSTGWTSEDQRIMRKLYSGEFD